MSIKQKAINSTKWVTTSTVIQTLLQFAQIAVLARILEPAAFGVVSLSTTVITFFSMFTNLGFANSIISRQETDRRVLSTVYFLNILLGAIIFIIAFFSSSLIAGFYNEQRLDKVIKLSSIIFLIIYFGSVHSSLLQKELHFKSVAIIDITGSLVGILSTISLAYQGQQELSIVYGTLLMQVTRTILQIILGRKLFSPLFHFDISEVKSHLRFGIYNFGDGIVSYIQSNWDNIILGKLLGTQLLGYYTLAYQLAIFPINKINPIILQVAYPILAKMKDDTSELKKAYLKILDILSYFNLPLLAGLYITCESIVPLVYGPGWEPTFPLIKIFVFVSALNCLSHPLFTLAYSKDKPNLLFYLNAITLAVKIPLVYFMGKYWNITGIAFSFLLATFINLVLNFCIVHYFIGNFIKEFLINIIKPVFFSLIMIAIVHFYKSYIGYTGIINSIVEVAIGGLIYITLTLKFKYSLSDIKSLKRTV